MPWCTRSTQQSLLAPCPLEGFALDHERGFFRCDEALLDSLIDLGDQLGVLVTATGRVNATKGMVVRMDDGVFHQDSKGVLIWFSHRVSPLAACSHDALHPRMSYNHRENQGCLTGLWFSNRWLSSPNC